MTHRKCLPYIYAGLAGIIHGDKVKITMRFRGREMAHQELGKDLLERVAEDTAEIGKIDSIPKMEGRQMTMMISPLK